VALAHDLDFSAILAATRGDQHSVVQTRSENVSPEVVGPAVISAVRQMTSELNEGALLTVEPGRMRVRLLPLRPG
jgi:predicted nuclease of predicted toxin-antitoxin system